MVVPTGTLAASSGPLLEVVKVSDFPLPAALFSLIALVAVSNSALINLIMGSRLVYGMANRGIVPRLLGKVHHGRRTPVMAILFVALIGVVLVSTADVEALGATTAALLLGVFTLVNVTVLVLRRDRVEHPHFVAPTVMPVLGPSSARPAHAPGGKRVGEGGRVAADRRRPVVGEPGDQRPGRDTEGRRTRVARRVGGIIVRWLNEMRGPQYNADVSEAVNRPAVCTRSTSGGSRAGSSPSRSNRAANQVRSPALQRAPGGFFRIFPLDRGRTPVHTRLRIARGGVTWVCCCT